MKCNNCAVDFSSDEEGLLVLEARNPVTALCGECLAGVRTCKVVLRRSDDGRFGYEQYSALEMTKKAFGKTG